MKKNLLQSLLAVSVTVSSMAQSPLDPTYGDHGTVHNPYFTLDYEPTAQWATIKVTPDGGSLVAGFFNTTYLEGTNGVYFKLLPSGALDPSFGNGGQVYVDRYPKESYRDIVLLDNGNAVLVGNAVNEQGLDVAFITTIAPNGQELSHVEVDRALTGSGVTLTNGILDKDNGDLILAGYTYNPASSSKDVVVVKLTSFAYLHGSAQAVPSFGKNGSVFVNIGVDDKSFKLLQRPNGTLLVVGYGNANGQDVVTVAQLKPSGALDTQFGTNGKLTLKLSPSSTGDRGYKAALQPDGKLVIVGSSKLNNKDVVAIARLQNNGTFDNSFDFDGKAFLYIGGRNDRATDVQVLADGKILLAGTSEYQDLYGPYIYTQQFLIRLLPNGTRDASFASQGLKVHPTNSYTDPYGTHRTVVMAVQQDGSILTESNGYYKFMTSKWLNSPFNKAVFTFNTAALPAGTTTTIECGDVVQFTPTQSTGSHRWNFGDGSPTVNTTAPSHAYQSSGSFNVKHWVIVGAGDTTLYQAAVPVKKFPNITTAGDYLNPQPAATELFDLYYYEQGVNKVNYLWESPQSTLGAQTTPTARFQYNQPGIYPVQLTVTDKIKGSSCKQVIKDTLYISAPFYGCYMNEGEELGANLIVNGDFNNGTCPATTFATQYAWKCEKDGFFEPNKVAIVSDALQFGTYFQKSSASLPQLKGNFLLVSSEWSRLNIQNIVNRAFWSQDVTVQAGKTYRFSAKLAELSNQLVGDYNFNHVTLLIDGVPSVLVTNNEDICASYTATTSKKVNLKLVKTNGFRVINGSLGVDDIVFAPITKPAPQLRQEEVGFETANGTASLAIAPNPANEVVQLYYRLPKTSAGAYVQILDIHSGQVLQSHPATGQQLSLSLEGMANGMYVVKLFEGDGTLLGVQKFMSLK